MRVRNAFIAGALAICATALVSAQDARMEPTQISVGPTVHVSVAYPKLPHYENEAVGDLNHPGRLVTCTGVVPAMPNQFYGEYCYVSFDNGATWEPSLKLSQRWSDFDPAVAYGLGDDVFAAALVYDIDNGPFWTPDQPIPHNEDTVIYKSTDGGHTFKEISRFPMQDREDIRVDTTGGKYNGTIYVTEQGGVPDINGGESRDALYMWHSTDGGRTFLGPVVAAYGPNVTLFGVATGVVLSDGTYAIMFNTTKPGMDQSENLDKTPNAEVHVITSRDGGQTFDTAHTIASIISDRPRTEGGIIGELAADPGSTYFKDRMYAVFQAVVDERVQIELSYSADKGKTWSKSIIVNDDRSPVDGSHGPDHMLPSVAVNKDGVVMVSWYDRRNAKDNLGWQVRAAASLDGGQTFSNSIAVSPYGSSFGPTQPWDVDVRGGNDKTHSMESMDASLQGFFVAGGHTSGMAASGDGTFHPTWIDNHTGVSQLWSATLTVNGTVDKNGSPELAGLDDISKSIAVELDKPVFDRAHGTLTVHAVLKNTSKDPIVGPLKIRVLDMTSGLGVPEVTNADNGMIGRGAIWDFTSLIPGGKLDSLSRSDPRTLTFHIDGLRALGQGRDFDGSIFRLDARVYGKVQTEKPATATPATKTGSGI
jgi:hypothetical protein